MPSKEELFIKKHLLNKNYTFAKTMSNNPHFYTLKSDWEKPQDFIKCAKIIWIYGTDEEYKGRQYRVLYYQDYKYWTMSEMRYSERYFKYECSLINRAKEKN